MMRSSTELVDVWKQWRQRTSAQLRWGLPWLERRLGAPFPGGLLVVGARPNVGKSFWTLELCRALADVGHTTCYLSLEDAPHEVGRRMALGLAHKGLLCGFPEGRLSAVCDAVEEAGQSGAQVVAVDYVQVCGYDGDVQVFGDAGSLSRVVVELKAAFKRAGVVGVLDSQLRRQSSGAPPSFPTLNELKGSGAIEEVAEWVVLLGKSRGGKGVVAEVAKSKNGAVGARQRFVRGDGGRLTELEDGEEVQDELDA